jgi:4-aminobutyrate aminotransferase-like enzyme/Ser/Thr protein kinase RdoA (MazF antagonist)
MYDGGMDRVLTADRPCLALADAVAVAAELFGVVAHGARDLGSERDRAFALEDAEGTTLAVLKVSNASEDPAVLDMEAAAALHVSEIDAELGVALPWRAATTGSPDRARPGDDVATLRAPWHDGDALHWVRLYDALPGAARTTPAQLPDAALIAWGDTAARLGVALRGFVHPRAERVMLWDVQHALRARELLGEIRDPHARAAVTRTLDAFEQRASPIWPRLRAQVLHADLTVDNALTDAGGFITGIVDFGDMSHTTLVADLASVLDSVTAGRPPAQLFRAARLVLDGYERQVPLEDAERETVGIAWAARSAVTIAISSWRVAQGLEEPDFAERYNAECLQTLEAFEAVGWDEVAHRLGGRGVPRPDPSLRERRDAAFGPAVDPLFYARPIEVFSATGVWITAADGRRYLDAYNNVPCVGHAHPRVTAAIARQSRTINTHTRYLHPAAIELAERLAATCPPELDTVLLVNSGSEANDWAWRLAVAATGNRGGLCTAVAYHGVTEATAALSPEGWLDGVKPDHVETFAAPDTYRDRDLDASAMEAAIARLSERGLAPAATILDALVISDGIADLDPAYVQQLVRLTRDAGGLWIADEVQAGHGRTGQTLWAFERFGIVPDFMTLGKPMGNGHPVAAVITKRSIVESLIGHTTLFSTFGGNPVSAAAALAVLDVIEDERVLPRVDAVGGVLERELHALAAAHAEIGDVRGVGLAWGVELVADPQTREPDGARARAVRDAMRDAGVLVGTTGRHGNVLKIRPPLALDARHVPLLVGALARALA